MIPSRRKVAAVSLLIALFATTGSALAQAVHPVCLAKAHECGNTAKISDCCCGNEGVPNSDSTPGQARTEVRPDLSATPALCCPVHIATAPRTVSAIQTSPPRLCPLDLPTLFAALLI